MTAQVDLGRLAVLPAWLAAPSNPSEVIAALRSVVPEVASGDLRITECGAKLRLKDGSGQGWAASYDVRVVDREGEERRLNLVGTFRPPWSDSEGAEPASVGPFGGEAWSGRFPDLGLELTNGQADVALPALPMLTDPVAARDLLQRALRDSCPDARITACVPQVMRYKPGSRCTVRYDLDLADAGSGPNRVVAKTYRGDKGANAFAGMRALWDADISSGAVVSLAEPLAYLPDLRLLLQGPVQEERTLKDLVRSTFGAGDGAHPDRAQLAELDGELRKAADGLAELHAAGFHHGELVTWDDELAEARDVVGRLSAPVPSAADAALDLLDRLEQQAAESTAGPLVPSHRSFRPAQVLLHRGRIAFIDFDGLCMAEPALDAALFRAGVRDAGAGALFRAARGPAEVASGLDALDELCDGFLDRYRASRPLSVERVALWETLDLLTFVVHCWTKIRPDRLRPRIMLLERHVRRSVAG